MHRYPRLRYKNWNWKFRKLHILKLYEKSSLKELICSRPVLTVEDLRGLQDILSEEEYLGKPKVKSGNKKQDYSRNLKLVPFVATMNFKHSSTHSESNINSYTKKPICLSSHYLIKNVWLQTNARNTKCQENT